MLILSKMAACLAHRKSMDFSIIRNELLDKSSIRFPSVFGTFTLYFPKISQKSTQFAKISYIIHCDCGDFK